MATARQLCARARQVMKSNAVLISGADYENHTIRRLQVYFWDEKEAVMDIISKDDLVEGWPDDGVYVFAEQGGEKDCLTPVRLLVHEEDFFLRAVPGDTPEDDLGPLPSVVCLEALELICQLKDTKF